MSEITEGHRIIEFTAEELSVLNITVELGSELVEHLFAGSDVSKLKTIFASIKEKTG